MAMRLDDFGQETSLADGAALDAWNRTQMAFLAHGQTTPEHLATVLSEVPEFALGHAVKGMFYLLLGRRELVETAREALVAARAGQACRREREYVEALAVWLDGSPQGAVWHLERVLRAHPGDTLAMKLSHAIRFVLGDAAGMRASVEAVLPTYGPDHPAFGYLLGCHSFALEETGAYGQAETAGRQALHHASDDAWGLHAVTHVCDMTGRTAAGIDLLNRHESAWAHCNNFRYHVWWHKALLHLEMGQIAQVLALYDREIRKDHTDDYRDISNAASLLCRLELEGVSVGARWEELADLSEARTTDGCLIFADLHYLLALIGGNRDAAMAGLIARIERDGARRACEMGSRMADPGVAAAKGLEAFGAGDYSRAWRNLAAARNTMRLAGGSHAQRDVFERLTIDAAIRSGHGCDAEELLGERSAMRNGARDRFCEARLALIAQGRGSGAGFERVPAE